MKKPDLLITVSIIAISLIIALFISLFSDKKFGTKFIFDEADEKYAAFIDAYTTGVIHSDQSIKIRLASNYADTSMFGKPEKNTLFGFSPKIEGKMVWTDARTLEFLPDKSLKNGSFYQGELNLQELFPELNGDLKIFPFSFAVIPLQVSVETQSILYLPENESYQITLKLLSSDKIAQNEKLEQSLIIDYKNGNIKKEWSHQPEFHLVTLNDIKRNKNKNEELTIKWDNSALGTDQDFQKTIQIPSLASFTLIEAEASLEKENEIIATFSNILPEEDQLLGFIKINGKPAQNIQVQNNRLAIEVPQSENQIQEIVFEADLQDNKQNKLGQKITKSITVQSLKPGLRPGKNGYIIPVDKSGANYSFEAVGLHSVKVCIFEIDEDRAGYFLQGSDLQSPYGELRRFAKPVFFKTISLANQSGGNFNRPAIYHLPLDKMIKLNRNAIYQVNVAFGPENTTHPCGKQLANGFTSITTQNAIDGLNDEMRDENAYWYEFNPNKYQYDYDYNERENPCHDAYYNFSRILKNNLIVSNLGLTIQQTTDNQYHVFVNEMTEAAPEENVKIELYDYQMRILGDAKTNKSGYCAIKTDQKPFLAVAKKSDQSMLIKVESAQGLNLSSFDLAGNEVQNGMKGFIYTERGIWRPGDSIFVNFMLEDKKQEFNDFQPVVLEFSDPKGILADRQVTHKNQFGLYRFGLKTSENGITGNYKIKITAGQNKFFKNLPIEAIKPNRLKIDLKIENDQLALFKSNSARLNVRYLNGAKASKLKAHYSIAYQKSKTVFKGFENYSFDNQALQFEKTEETVFTGFLDENGNADFNISASSEMKAPGKLTGILKGKVFEPGGDFSIDNQKLDVYPYDKYIGIQIPKSNQYGFIDNNVNHTFQLAAVNEKGNPTVLGDVIVKIFKIDHGYWWDVGDQMLSTYISDEYYQPVFETEINSNQSKASFQYQPEEDWGNYLIWVSQKDQEFAHQSACTFYVDYPWFSGSRAKPMADAATQLKFSLSKSKVELGDEIAVNIPVQAAGHAIITVSNSKGMIMHDNIKTKGPNQSYTFKITEEMIPNAYVYISHTVPYAETGNDIPLRQYGIAGFEVNASSLILEPVIKAPEKHESGKNLSIEISEKNGKPMAFTLSVVDEGILGLTKFKTPQPQLYFNAKEAFLSKIFDVYDKVIGAYSGKIRQLLAIGGGDFMAMSNKAATDNNTGRFKSLVYHSEVIVLKPGEKKKFNIPVKTYTGEVRVMAVAKNKTATGSAEKSIIINQPLMLLASLPRVLRPGESVSVPVNIFNLSKKKQQVKVQLNKNKAFSFEGPDTETVEVAPDADKSVVFKVKLSPENQQAEFMITASADQISVSENVKFNIQNPNLPNQITNSYIAEKGKSITVDLPQAKGILSAMLSASTGKPFKVQKYLSSLIQYPYGCLEQTVSAAFPQMYLLKFSEVDAKQKNEINRNIQAAIQKIAGYKNTSGLLGYWPNHNWYNPYAAVYASWFLIEAKNMGFKVDPSLYQPTLNQSESVLQSMEFTQLAFPENTMQLYVLAKAGRPQKALMNQLKASKIEYSESNFWLAWAYAECGMTTAAKSIIEKSKFKEQHNESGYYFYSLLRPAVIQGEIALKTDDKTKLYQISEYIINFLNKDLYFNTQDLGFALSFLTKVNGMNPSGAKLKAEITGKQNKKTVNIDTEKNMSAINLLNELKGNQSFTIKNLSENNIYIESTLAYIPELGKESEFAENASLEISFSDENGQIINPEKLTQGKRFFAKINVSGSALNLNQRNLALLQIIPSGWEIINNRYLEESESETNSETYDFTDIKDDRIHWFFHLTGTETKTLTVELNASYAGKFYLPPTRFESMYYAAPKAQTKGKWVTVVPVK